MRRKGCGNIGLGIIAAGASILLACFMPPGVLVCVEAVLLVVAGILWLLSFK